MKIESEKLIEQKLTRLVKLNGGLSIKLLCDNFSGLPDRLVLMPQGKISFVELKTTGKKPRPIQLSIHAKLRKLGFNIETIDTTQKVLDFIDRIKAC